MNKKITPRQWVLFSIVIFITISLMNYNQETSKPTPSSEATTTLSVASTPSDSPPPPKDDFGVPANFQPQYHEDSSEDCTVGAATCRRISFTVPKGLSKKAVEYNLRFAVEEAYKNFNAVRGIAFARAEGTDMDGPYSVGRVMWGSDNGSGGSDVGAATTASSISIDYEESYFKPETPARSDVKRIPEDRRKAIFYAIGLSEDRATHEAEAAYPTSMNTTSADKAQQDVEPNAEMNNTLTEKYHSLVRKKYHISDNQFGSIMSEGIEKHWPTADPQKD